MAATVAVLFGLVLAMVASLLSPEEPPAEPPALRSPRDPAPPPEETIRKHLSAITIPVLEFEETTVEEAFDFLRQRIRELDPAADPTRRGIGLVVRKERVDRGAGPDEELETGSDPPDAGARTITYRARDVSAWEALEELCRQAHLTLTVGEHGLEFVPLATPNASP